MTSPVGSPRLGVGGRLVPEYFCIGARLSLILEIAYGLKQRDADFGAAGRAVFCWIRPRGDCQLGS